MVFSVNKYEELKNRPDEKRRVVFLDIDGVLQPVNAQDRFKHDMEALKAELAEKYGDEHFLELNKYDVAAVYYDWNEDAVSSLRSILEDCDAEIVLSSDWRQTKTLEDMRTLMKIHNLDKYLTDMVPETYRWSWKYEDIPAYLLEHPKLTRYVVVDDMYMEKYFRGRFVKCDRFLGHHECNQIYRLLKCNPWWEDKSYEMYTSHDLGRMIEDKYEKVIFLDIDGVLNDDGERRAEGEIICEEYVRNLREIVYKTNAEIVLSSSWREAVRRYTKGGSLDDDKDLSELYKLFDAYQLQIAGITPMICNGPDGRPLEIRTWLARRPRVSGFVILDDDSFWRWGWMKPFVVTTSWREMQKKGDYEFSNRMCGLNAEFREQAIEILNGGNEE